MEKNDSNFNLNFLAVRDMVLRILWSSKPLRSALTQRETNTSVAADSEFLRIHDKVRRTSLEEAPQRVIIEVSN